MGFVVYTKTAELLEYLRNNVLHESIDSFCERLDIGKSTYRKLRQGNASLGKSGEFIEKIVNNTKIPLEVVLRLAYGLPTLFDIESGQFADSPLTINESLFWDNIIKYGFDKMSFDEYPLSLYGELRTPNEADIVEISNYVKNRYRDLNIGDADHFIYRSVKSMAPICRIFRDTKGFHVGHLIVSAFKLRSHDDLTINYRNELDYIMNGEVINDRELAVSPSLIHVYSFYSANSRYSFWLLRDLINFVTYEHTRNIHPESYLTWFPTNKSSLSIAEYLKFSQVGPYQYEKIKGTEKPLGLYSVPVRKFVDTFRVEEWLRPYNLFDRNELR
ncbi:MAG: hypothetical protein KTR29_20450 [Rhodothermaceae bacterium]|nr:hypothetical protein [Rhodothermaceae bacterium]